MAGLKGKSGGARLNTGVKSKLTDPEVLKMWKSNLERAICIAASNSTILRKESFFGLREIAATFGKSAVKDFKDWFEAHKVFNQDVADRLYQQKASGKIDDAKFKKLLYSTAYSWVWSIRPEMQRKAWEISRGTSQLQETKKGS